MIDISIPFTIGLVVLGVQIYRIGVKNKHQKNKIPRIILTSMFFEFVYPYEFGKYVYNKIRSRKSSSDIISK